MPLIGFPMAHFIGKSKLTKREDFYLYKCTLSANFQRPFLGKVFPLTSVYIYIPTNYFCNFTIIIQRYPSFYDFTNINSTVVL